MSARLWTALRSHGVRRARGAAAAILLLAQLRARADEQRVSITCPQLDREGAAELESLARAALLTSNLRASLAIVCDGEGVLVVAHSVDHDSTVRAKPEGATFRDGALAAVDAALEQLRPPQAPVAPAPISDAARPEPSALELPASPSSQPPVLQPAPAPRPRPAESTLGARPSRARLSALHSEVYGAAGLEAWSADLAGTVSLGVRRGGRYVWLGIRGGAARQFSRDADFSATELAFTLEAVFVPDLELGLRAALSIGPSWLVVSPSERLTALGAETTAALLIGAELSRPVWLGRFALVPSVGLRFFGRQRGVRLDGAEQLVLAGFQPNLTLGLVYRLD